MIKQRYVIQVAVLSLVLGFISTAWGAVWGDINGDSRIGLEETIHSLQVVAGIKTYIDKSFLIGEWEYQNSENQYRMRVEWDDIGERFEGTLTKQGQLSEYVGFTLGELCWIVVPTDDPKVLTEQQKWRTGANGVSTSYEWRNGTIKLEECTNNELITPNGKFLRVTETVHTSSAQLFLTGEWESQDLDNHYRMRVELNEKKQRFEGFLSKQGQLSEHVGFTLEELCWIATPTVDENVLMEQQKWRTGANGISTGYEWRNGTIDLTECSDNKIVNSSDRSFLKN